ncbi:uncharacterized protein LOC130677690 [Microplitis mediator]|uniref:uncharacterized protein LOC130677690 n=1 Tax=Microplitis mediator TaxID=375433 RepID=UPI002556F7D8|nr:uncharacterized protein LOC130677690 [Microplitis mediator]
MTLLLTNKADINAKSDDEIILIINALVKYVLDLFCICEGDRNTKTIFHAAADIKNYTELKNWLISFSRRGDLKKNSEFFLYFKSLMRSHMFRHNHHPIFDDGIDSIRRHIVELITAGFYVSDRNITDINNTKRYDNYSAECLLEVEKMKKNVIEGSNITFIEILHKNVRYLARYLKIVDLNKILIREPQFPEYPIYENKIYFKLWKTQIRVNYVKDSEEVIYNIFYELQLPDTFIRELYIYLSNDDLKEIVEPST